MSALDSKPFGYEAEDKSTGDLNSALSASIKFDGRPAYSAAYDGANAPKESPVSQVQFNDVGRK